MLDRRLKMQGLAIWKNLRYLIYGVRNTDWTPAWKRLKGNLKLQIANGFLNAVSYRQNGQTNTLQVIYRRKIQPLDRWQEIGFRECEYKQSFFATTLLIYERNRITMYSLNCFIASIVCKAFQTCFAEFFPAIWWPLWSLERVSVAAMAVDFRRCRAVNRHSNVM